MASRLLKQSFMCCAMVRDGAFAPPHHEVCACFPHPEEGRKARLEGCHNFFSNLLGRIFQMTRYRVEQLTI